MEAERSSESSVDFCAPTQRHIAEDCNLLVITCRNLSLLFCLSIVRFLAVIINLFQPQGHHLFSASVTELERTDGRDFVLPQKLMGYNVTPCIISHYTFLHLALAMFFIPLPSFTSFFPFFVNKMAAADPGTSAYMPPHLYSLPSTHPSVPYDPSATPYTSTSQPPTDQADISVCKGGN